jgi:hypothetical protein
LSLDAFFEKEPIQTIEEKIKQRRTQMLLHSYLYYELDSPIITDDKWQQWADELTELQETIKVIGFYDEAFADWSGATGCHLPFDDLIIKKAKCAVSGKWEDYYKNKA